MSHVAALVFGTAALLAVIAFLPAMASRLRLPTTVLLAAAGCAVGVGVQLAQDLAPGAAGGLEPLLGFVRTLGSFGLTSELFLSVFLPLLLFETALNLDARDLLDDLGPILALAVLAVLLCAAVAGAAVWLASGFGIVACLLVASIVATTDPAAVIAVFREVGAPRRLVSLVEGESLLNDAAAIALAAALLTALATAEALDPAHLAEAFAWEFAGGAALGAALGRLAGLAVSRLDRGGPGEVTLSLALAYLAYGVADSVLHVSGVVAVVIAGLVFGSIGRARVGSREWTALSGIWAQLGFWASSLIFVLASTRVPAAVEAATWSDLGALAALTAGATLARALTLYGVLPVVAEAFGSRPIDRRYKAVILWGGLRGAVTLALALAVTENPAVPEPVRHLVSVLATGYVLFTLLVQGTTLPWLIRYLGLNRLPPVERALRARALDLAKAEVRDELSASAILHGLDLEASLATREVLAAPAAPAVPPEPAAEMLKQQLVAALATVIARERTLYIDEVGSRMIARVSAARALRDTATLLDAVKGEGLQGYRDAVRRLNALDRGTRLAAWAHRAFGLTGPLARRLARRLELLLVKRRVVEELLTFTRGRIRALFGQRPADAIAGLLEARLEQVDRALEALQLQYPNYWQEALDRYLARIAVRLEWDRYERMHEERIISPQLLRDLVGGLRARQRRLQRIPRLDLGLDGAAMIRGVPLFERLGEGQVRKLRRLLRPRLALPDQRIVRRGEPGEAMFFIVSGAVEVILPGEPVRLGTGEFFGEMALIQRRPRTADVLALGYCQLLELRRDAFRRLLKLDPGLMREVRQVAERRLRGEGPRPAEAEDREDRPALDGLPEPAAAA